jgi:hypothetical protein
MALCKEGGVLMLMQVGQMDSTYLLPPTPTSAELYIGIFTEYIEGRSPYTRLTVASNTRQPESLN